MKLIVKTLKGGQFEVEPEEGWTVAQLKGKIEEMKKDDAAPMPAELQKLVVSGKIMEDEKPLTEYNLKDGSFIVAMVSKPKVDKPKPAPPQPSP